MFCELLHRSSFLISYTCLEYVIVFGFEHLFVEESAQKKIAMCKLFIFLQFAGLCACYVAFFVLGACGAFEKPGEQIQEGETMQDVDGRVGEGYKSDVHKISDQLQTVFLHLIFSVVLANWFFVLSSALASLNTSGTDFYNALWGSESARVCTWILVVMQTQLLVTTYSCMVQYSSSAPLIVGLRPSVLQYSISYMLVLMYTAAEKKTMVLLDAADKTSSVAAPAVQGEISAVPMGDMSEALHTTKNFLDKPLSIRHRDILLYVAICCYGAMVAP